MAKVARIIARELPKALKQPGIVESTAATLIKVTPGTRTVGNPAGGTNPTTTSYAAKGFVSSKLTRRVGGTLVEANDRVVVLFGASIASGQVPTTKDKITIEGKTQAIIDLDRDPASATYTCLCRGPLT